MPDTAVFHADVVAVADLPVVVVVRLSSEEGRDDLGFRNMDCSGHKLLVDTLECFMTFEYDVGRELGLLNSPMIHSTKVVGNFTERSRKTLRNFFRVAICEEFHGPDLRNCSFWFWLC